jgi:hypothetical protein
MPSITHLQLLARLAPEDAAVVDWLYEATREPKVGVMLWGMAQMCAADHQDWTFFQVLREIKSHLTIIQEPPPEETRPN